MIIAWRRRCVMMCVVHDLAEAQGQIILISGDQYSYSQGVAAVGDIAPHEGISKAEKRRLEEEAMHSFVHEMLHNSPAAQRIEALYKEYETGETAEARFIWIDLRWQLRATLEYEKDKGPRSLQPFFDSASLPNLRHPEVRGWGNDLVEERDRLFPKDGNT
ncbi:hypothetical protein PQX77_013100 [Marasmius sp. AFHP31]|nr:hypothetical protein PQX77_013100 [Marasmius sp. AFHP31]